MKHILLLVPLLVILANCTREATPPTTPIQPPTAESSPTSVPVPDVTPAPVTAH